MLRYNNMDEQKDKEKAEILSQPQFVMRIPDCCRDVMEGKREYCDHSSQPKERKKINKAL